MVDRIMRPCLTRGRERGQGKNCSNAYIGQSTMLPRQVGGFGLHLIAESEEVASLLRFGLGVFVPGCILIGFTPDHNYYADSSRWPPNFWRIAESIFSAKVCGCRERKRV